MEAPEVVGDPALPDWYYEAEHNLIALLRNGSLYLRACDICTALFTSRDKRQLNCQRPDCLRATNRSRQQKARQVRCTQKAAVKTARIERALRAAERASGAFGAREQRRNAK